MKPFAVICLLLAVAAAAPLGDDSEASPDTSSTSSHVKELLDQAQADRPKKARQLFAKGAYKRTLRRRTKEGRSEAEPEDAAAEGKEVLKGEELGQAEGWSPIALSGRQLAQARSLPSADTKPAADAADLSGDASGETEDSVSGEDLEEDREAENSYLSPLYAPAPGGYGGYGGGHGPYIYIVPIVLPPAGPHRAPAARHVVTETGHESHHYSGGPAPYRPLYPGSYVPPIYIPKGYGIHGGHGVHHGGHGVHGKHGGHTTVHHEDKTIIRDIDPPIFKA